MLLRGIGTDIVDVRRFARLVARDSFTARWFTAREAERCATSADAPSAFAEVYAAKEAAWKAIRVEWSKGVPWASMEVVPRGGASTVVLSGDVADAASAVGVQRILVTTAADAEMAMAHALAVLEPAQPTSEARYAP